jgi:3-hydroxybutyryl-CoA dehydratase
VGNGQGQGIEVGASASLTRVVEAEDVEAFARLTGDTNPIHLDDEYAGRSRFGRRIAHGALVAGYISAVLGTTLPGPGSIYLSQTLAFKAPVFIGDTVTATVTVTNVRPDKPVVTFDTRCANQDGQVVLEGEAVLLCPQLRQ